MNLNALRKFRGRHRVQAGKIAGNGHNFASPAGDQIRNWDGDFMLRKKSASSRLVRVGVFGLAAIATAAFTTGNADARRYHHRHYHSHSSDDDSDSYNPKFSSIIVDGNSGSILEANSPDGLRHPASLTKVMTLYLLFERLDAGKITLDTEMPVSEHAADQDPTKLGLRPGQTIRVEDAIKGIVTRSANDAAVVIGEYIGGNEEDFAKMMTRKAHALGMSRTVYRNASGLPNDEQVTTARDQSTLGRAIQDRFPRYYHFFSTTAFNFRGHTITGHNHLLGSVEGVDGIKTGYIRASGFNLITSIHRGNRFLVGVVMGGRSGGSRDAIMRNLLAENITRAATVRTVAAITEHNGSDGNVDVAAAEPAPAPRSAPVQTAASVPMPAAAEEQDPNAPPAMRSRVSRMTAAIAQATAAVPPANARVEPAPMTSGVIQTQPMALIPGSSEPMKPVRVKACFGRSESARGPDHQLHSGHGERAGNLARHRRQGDRCPGRGQQFGLCAAGDAQRIAATTAGPRHRQRPARRAAGQQRARRSPCSAARRRRPGTAGGCLRCAGGRNSGPDQAGRHAYRLDRPGRRARQRGRSATAHRSRPQQRPRPAQQG
jgi:D-alanyl-D-alanine carboxypeptidase